MLQKGTENLMSGGRALVPALPLERGIEFPVSSFEFPTPVASLYFKASIKASPNTSRRQPPMPAALSA